MAACSNNRESPALQAPVEAERRNNSRAPRRRCPGWYAEVNSESSGAGETAMSVRYAVIFEQAESNWAAYVPDLPGCITTGRTLEETERNIREAISGHLQTLREF